MTVTLNKHYDIRAYMYTYIYREILFFVFFYIRVLVDIIVLVAPTE